MADAAPDAAGEPKPEGAVLFKRKSRGHMKGRMRKKTKAAKVAEEEKESSSDEGEVVRKEKTKSNVHRVRPESPSRWRVLSRSGGKGAEHAPRLRARAPRQMRRPKAASDQVGVQHAANASLVRSGTLRWSFHGACLF